MNRSDKEAFVSSFKQGIDSARAFALLSFNKLTVEQMTNVRLGLKKKSVNVKVVKNTLAKRVLNESAFKDLSQHLEGPTLVAYGAGDPVLTTKAIFEWIGKENLDIKLKAGAALGQVLSESQLKALSKLPSREEMLVSFLWALKSHPTRFLYAVQDVPRRLGYALNALREKKEKEANI